MKSSPPLARRGPQRTGQLGAHSVRSFRWEFDIASVSGLNTVPPDRRDWLNTIDAE
jgi:hypothetical protein